MPMVKFAPDGGEFWVRDGVDVTQEVSRWIAQNGYGPRQTWGVSELFHFRLSF